MLKKGDKLVRGNWMTSPNEKFLLYMQFDGNLAFYAVESRSTLWSSNTIFEGDLFRINENGNLDIYDTISNQSVWQHEIIINADHLDIEDDGTLAVYDYFSNREVVWTASVIKSETYRVFFLFR